MNARFYAPDARDTGSEVDLPDDEAQHLSRVLRLGAGDSLVVFNGDGDEFAAAVATVGKTRVAVRLLARVPSRAELPVALTLAQAVLKGDKMDDVVRDAVMLGANAVQPLVTKRSETTVAALLTGARVERWRRVVLASAKQSGRAVLPEVRTPLTVENYLEEPAAALRLMLVEPSADEKPEPISALRGAPVPGDVGVMVGPEGGWTGEERALARNHGVRLLTLGPRTLRAEAVGLSALSVLQFLWES
jgi:16S rRNA (uracil1498-N3)-methyltransferase